jgi:cytochrome c-type biogenesis protein CcmH/NrfG
MNARWWPNCFSGWLLAAAILAMTAFMVNYCLWCHWRIVRNGGYAYAVESFLNGN